MGVAALSSSSDSLCPLGGFLSMPPREPPFHVNLNGFLGLFLTDTGGLVAFMIAEPISQDFCEWYRDVANASTSMISTSAGVGGYIDALLACKGTLDPGQWVGECLDVPGWRERKKTCARRKGISLALARGMVGQL